MTSNTSKNEGSFLSTAPIGRLFFRMAIPTITAQLINMLYNLVDRMYIGRIEDVGALALTGVGICMPIIFVISAFAALIGYGGAPRASIFLGGGDNNAAEKVLGNCFTSLFIISLILTPITVIFSEEFLLLFGASEDTIEYATSYLNIYAFGTIFVQMALGMNSFITAQGFTRISMCAILLGAVTNIILDPIFIFGLNMGVKGAALATVISQGLSAFFVISFLFSRHSNLRIRTKNLRPDMKVILSCVALGFSPFIMQITESITIISFNSSLLRYGGDIAVGAMTICTSSMQLVMLPLHGLSQGAQPITGYNLGAGNVDRVRRVYKTLLMSAVVFTTLMWLFIMFFPQVFAGMFTEDAALIEYSKFALRIYMAGTITKGFMIPNQMTFLAIGCAKESAFGAIMRKVILLIPLIYILPVFFENKVMAVFLAEPIADVSAAIFTAILFYFTFRRVLKGVETKKEFEE